MRIGIIGSGNVGGALGTRWAAGGHTVVFASRNPGSAAMMELTARAWNGARAATAAEAAAASEVIVLATPWPGTRAAVLGLGSLEGKILVDATNPLLDGLAGLEYGTTTSGAEQVAAWAPGARVVKAFNTVGNNVMADTAFAGGKPVLFYCGDDGDAKAAVDGLAAELGFDARDAGGLAQARLLEPLALLWIRLALFQGLGRGFAFQVLQREGE